MDGISGKNSRVIVDRVKQKRRHVSVVITGYHFPIQMHNVERFFAVLLLAAGGSKVAQQEAY